MPVKFQYENVSLNSPVNSSKSYMDLEKFESTLTFRKMPFKRENINFKKGNISFEITKVIKNPCTLYEWKKAQSLWKN